jgi:putative two-component system response regulator
MASLRSPDDKPVILVVDDTPQNLSLMCELLEQDYTLKLATSGARALKIATASTPPDLILLDIMMPEMDGYEVCRQLKADPATADIPVIFVTALAEIENEEQGFALGAVDYITKPVSPSIVHSASAHAHSHQGCARPP